ncbi:MAG: hypothetical protein CMP20_10330 [Rickettsiales bacterium]|nr:hypothetical protein [Rickettsiales bacterium]
MGNCKSSTDRPKHNTPMVDGTVRTKTFVNGKLVSEEVRKLGDTDVTVGPNGFVVVQLGKNKSVTFKTD